MRHVQVVGALARLAGHGGWARILDGRPLEDETDRADADLLVAAEVLELRTDGSLVPRDLHPWYDDPEVLASGLNAQLRRALHHSQGATPDGIDPVEVTAMGVASQSVAAILADAVLPMLPVSYDRLLSGTGRFLDVGVGTGSIAEALCRRFPGTTAVGVDISRDVLGMAEDRLEDSPVAEHIELRHQSVATMVEEDAFDLAWLPQIFVTRADLELGLRTVHRALRAGCWLVMPVAAPDESASDLERAALAHDAVSRGGGPMSLRTAEALLETAGFVGVRRMPGVSQTLVMARKP